VRFSVQKGAAHQGEVDERNAETKANPGVATATRERREQNPNDKDGESEYSQR
jgi:hypothetical protein